MYERMKGDQLRNQIMSVAHLKMVKFYRLFGEDGPMCGILAYYLDKTINLCEADAHFTLLFDRIAAAYADEKEWADILADEETETVLANANVYTEDAYQKLLSGYEEIKVPIVLPKAFFHIWLMPVVKYIIKLLYDGEETVLTFAERNAEWFGKGVLEAMFGEKALRFSYQIAQLAGEHYEVTVRDILQIGNLMKFEFAFMGSSMAVSYHDTFFQYTGSLYFRVTEQGAELAHVLKEKDKELLTTEEECPEKKGAVPTERVRKLTGRADGDWKAYELPWGDIAYYAEDMSEEYRVIESYSAVGMRTSKISCFRRVTGEDVPIDFGMYHMRLFEREDVTELHLLSLDAPANGLYNARYAGRYYK